MKTKKNSANKQEVLTDEKAQYLMHANNQTWLHHRHMENMRSQYMGFYFTVIIGLSAYSAKTEATWDSPLFLLLIFIVFFLTVFLFFSIIKMNSVITAYETMMNIVRGQFVAEYADLNNLLNVRNLLPKSIKPQIFSLSRWTEGLLLSSMMLITGPFIFYVCKSNFCYILENKPIIIIMAVIFFVITFLSCIKYYVVIKDKVSPYDKGEKP